MMPGDCCIPRRRRALVVGFLTLAAAEGLVPPTSLLSGALVVLAALVGMVPTISEVVMMAALGVSPEEQGLEIWSAPP